MISTNVGLKTPSTETIPRDLKTLNIPGWIVKLQAHLLGGIFLWMTNQVRSCTAGRRVSFQEPEITGQVSGFSYQSYLKLPLFFLSPSGCLQFFTIRVIGTEKEEWRGSLLSLWLMLHSKGVCLFPHLLSALAKATDNPIRCLTDPDWEVNTAVFPSTTICFISFN